MKEKNKKSIGRRDFLKLMSAGALVTSLQGCSKSGVRQAALPIEGEINTADRMTYIYYIP